MKYNIPLWLLFLFCLSAEAQDVLSLEQAIDSALMNNYRIAVARNNVTIAENNNHPGQAGMLPNVGVNISDSPANNNLRQEFANGSEIVRNNVNSNSLNAQIAANMTLYDGGRMFAARARLNEEQTLAELSFISEMQNLISDVISAYTTLVAQQQNEKVLLKLQESAKARKQLIEVRMSAGLANNSDLFLAELDLDNAAQALVTSSQQMMRASAALKSLMKSINPNVLRVVEEVPESLQPERLSADGLFQNNPEVNMSGTSVKIAVQSEKEASALRYPKVTLTAAYGYLLSQSQAGFSLYNQTYGASGSLGINVPLFSGNVYKNNHQNAIIARKNTELEAEQVKNDIMQHYILAWQLYESANARQILLESSVKTASDYLALMTLRFNEGQSTVIELREAERSFEEANYRKISNEVTLKLAETDILRISGQLIR